MREDKDDRVQNRRGVQMRSARNIQTKRIAKNGGDEKRLSALDANELKAVVRDGLVAMTVTEREEFIGTLESELRRSGINLRSYLVPLGIPARSSEELTPTEVAHLVRFIKLNKPEAMPAIERAIQRYDAFSERPGRGDHRIAA